MTQDEKWMARYEEVMAFIEANHWNPSKHRIEEHDMLNWVKANRKALNAGEMKEKRVEEDSTDEEEYANQPEVMIPYNSTLVAGIPESFEELDLEICEFNLDMEKAEYFNYDA